MKKTLVIHPKDFSTDFLKPIYEEIPYKTIVNGVLTVEQINKLIKEHDRIIMLGHGTPDGLLGVGRFDRPYAISHETAKYLRPKECVYIWCNADQYCIKNNLKGLYSGMFISEVGEAVVCGVKNPTQKMVNESNDIFSEVMRITIDKELEVIHETLMDDYGALAKTNPIAYYNNKRLYLNQQPKTLITENDSLN
jgi:hypothetical protein